MASTDAEIDALAKQISDLAARVHADKDDAARKKFLGVAMGAVAQLDTPVEATWKLIMSPHAPSALMCIIQMGALHEVVASDKPLSAADLSKKCNADELLIARLMRPLLCLGYFTEVDEFTYSATPLAQALDTPGLTGGYTAMFAGATHSLSRMPWYLEQSKWKHVDGFPGPFQHVKDQKPYFQWLLANPDIMSHFNNFMSVQRIDRPDWFQRLPVEDIFLSGASSDPDAVLLVDIAGGEGHDIEAFRKKYPDAPGKLVLEELPPVLENIKAQGKDVHDSIVRQPIDFFEPQPIKGARVYYFRSIFHDWPDKDCTTILKHTAAAMTKGYSKILINEFILPEKNVPMYPALLDINMMALLNGMERTSKQWTKLLETAGLKVVKMHTFSASGDEEGVIEAELA